MRKRISNGEDWNVREAYVSQETTIITHDEDGNFVEDIKKVPTVMGNIKGMVSFN